MIISEYIPFKINKFNVKKFKSLGYKCEIDSVINLHYTHLPKNNRIKEKFDVKCDRCKCVYSVQMRSLLSNKHLCQPCKFRNITNNETIKKRVLSCENTKREKEKIDPLYRQKIYNKVSSKSIDLYGNYNNFEKILKSSYHSKKFKNTDLSYRASYEFNFLELCEKMNLIGKIDKPKPIQYFFLNKKHFYYPDFFIKELNLVIEIKSTYTFNRDVEKNLEKKKYAIAEGYDFLFIIDKQYDEFIEKIKNIRWVV